MTRTGSDASALLRVVRVGERSAADLARVAEKIEDARRVALGAPASDSRPPPIALTWEDLNAIAPLLRDVLEGRR